MNLMQAMRVVPGECIAFTGAGGKTTALFTLARNINAPVLVTTTTHFGLDQLSMADKILQVDPSTDLNEIIENLNEGILLVKGQSEENGKVSGIPENKLQELFRASRDLNFTLLIEADGSRQLPIKAPASHEPVIPQFVDRVVVVAGLSGIGKPLNENWVHRTDRFAKISGLAYGELITQAALIDVLKNRKGGLKGIPQNAKRTVLLNQADDSNLQAQGNRIAVHLNEVYDAVIVASLSSTEEAMKSFPKEQSFRKENVYAVHEPIAAVILAAGKAERMGRAKQLLPWRSKPLLWHVAQAVIGEGIKEILVVVGAHGEKIRKSLQDPSIRFIDNPDWQAGQSTSLKAGLSALQARTAGVIFLLADQPQISSTLVRSLIEKHAITLAPIIAPLVDGRRGNPVLFDRITFEDLMQVQGDQGGREIFSRYPVEWVEWHDASALIDIDTEADYQRLLNGDY
jgi:molybdenum cofactor cytidylyltransferase